MTDLHSLNRSYLIVVRDTIKTDPAKACAVYNVNSEFASALAAMTLAEIEVVAQTDVILFAPTITGKCLTQLRDATDKTSRTVAATLSGARHG